MDWNHNWGRVTFPRCASVTACTGKSSWRIRAQLCSSKLWMFHRCSDGSHRTCPWFWLFSLPQAIVSFQHFHVAGNLFVLCPSVPKPPRAGIQILLASPNKDLCHCQASARSAVQQHQELSGDLCSQHREGKSGQAGSSFHHGVCSSSRCCGIAVVWVNNFNSGFRCCTGP